jgi:hypothetical protein
VAVISRATITWRYLSRGKAKHALPLDGNAVTGHQVSALCGTMPAWFAPSPAWMGTGSQTEYETVDELPECRRCARLLAPPTDERHPAPTSPTGDTTDDH